MAIKLNRVLGGLIAISWSLATIHPAQAAAPKTSTGVTCTIVGTAGNNVITGTKGKDVICGLGGNDTIKGMGGNDIIDGGAGNDVISGGDGNDAILAGAGNDKVSGDAGNDVEDGGAGNDSLSGGTGNDTENGGAGNDTETGDAGNDTQTGGDGNDALSGGTGNDIEAGGGGDDQVTGGDGTDSENGGAGNDKLYGDAGADALQGEAGNDGLIGGAGADTLAGSTGEPAPAERNLCEKDAADVVTYCGFDEAAPWIASADLAQSSVDSSTGDQVVPLTLHVTDELMGVDSVGCSVTFEGARMSTGYQRATRTAGDAIDGTYTCNVTIPLGGSTGRWGVNLDTRDRAGNMGMAYQVTDGKWHSNLPEIMAQSPSHWIEQTGVGDNQSPRITNPTFSKTTIDTSAGADTFNLDVTVSDDFSGVKKIGCSARHNSVENTDISIVVTKLSGTDKNGVWRCAVTLPKNSGQGKWYMSVAAEDNTGKHYSVSGKPGTDTMWLVDDTSELMAQPPLDLGTNFITQVGAGDDELPSMASITLDKAKVNTASSDQTIVATLNLIDLQSGIKSVELRSFSPSTFAQNVATCAFTSKDGTGNEVWTCTLKLPLGSQKGFHTFMVMMFDKVGNRVTYSYNATTNMWSLRPLSFYDNYTVENLDLGPAGILNTDQ